MATENVESVEELIAEAHETRKRVIFGGQRAGKDAPEAYRQELIKVEAKFDIANFAIKHLKDHLIEIEGTNTNLLNKYVDEIEALDNRIESLERGKCRYAKKYRQAERERNSFEMNFRNEVIVSNKLREDIKSKRGIMIMTTIIFVGSIVGLIVAAILM